MSGWKDSPYLLGSVPLWSREEASQALDQAWLGAPREEREPVHDFDRCPICLQFGVVLVTDTGVLVEHTSRLFPCRVARRKERS